MSGEVDLLLRTIAAFDADATPDRDTFPMSFVERVAFERWTLGNDTPASSVDGFGPWFASLRDRGVSRLQLAFPSVNAPGAPPDRARFGFSNATGGFLVAAGPHPERWRALWKVGDRQAPDRRIWQITFQGVGEPGALLPPPAPVDDVTAALLAAIAACHDVAARSGLTGWERFFARAHAVGTAPGDGRAVEVPGVPPLPAGWRRPDALRLLHAARAANGFGGMGSWNDQGFTDQAVQAAYVEASQRLFVLVLHAFVAGANSV